MLSTLSKNEFLLKHLEGLFDNTASLTAKENLLVTLRSVESVYMCICPLLVVLPHSLGWAISYRAILIPGYRKNIQRGGLI
jgi:hypothetical protein